MSQTALAHAVGVPPRRINEIVLGKRSVTADTDLRLGRYWGLTPGFWLKLQNDHDLMAALRATGPAGARANAALVAWPSLHRRQM